MASLNDISDYIDEGKEMEDSEVMATPVEETAESPEMVEADENVLDVEGSETEQKNDVDEQTGITSNETETEETETSPTENDTDDHKPTEEMSVDQEPLLPDETLEEGDVAPPSPVALDVTSEVTATETSVTAATEAPETVTTPAPLPPLVSVKEEILDEPTLYIGPSPVAMKIDRLSNSLQRDFDRHSNSLQRDYLISNKPSRMTVLKDNVEQKSHLLSNVWTELYSLLGEYKAELFSKHEITEKYDVSNDSQLRDDLLDKDNEIVELRTQLEEFQKHAEQWQIDISVKDSLLKKYQEDLLQKEAALMTTQSKVTRLENRLRAIESRAQFDGPPRKIVRTPMTPARSPSYAGRSLPMRSTLGIGPRPGVSRSPMMGRMSANTMPRRRMQMTTQTTQRQMHPPSAPVVRTTPIRPPPAPSEKQPVICIEVDDDDELQEITDATQALEHQPVDNRTQSDPFTNWEAGQEPDGAPSDGQYGSQFDSSHSMDLTESSLVEPQAGFSGDSLEQSQPWPVELTQSQSMQQLQSPAGMNKLTCPHCDRRFTHTSGMNYHVNVVHKGIKKHRCHICNHSFGKRHGLNMHLTRVHKQFVVGLYRS